MAKIKFTLDQRRIYPGAPRHQYCIPIRMKKALYRDVKYIIYMNTSAMKYVEDSKWIYAFVGPP